eukprot:jgi/Mesen1/3335/ME000191S02471
MSSGKSGSGSGSSREAPGGSKSPSRRHPTHAPGGANTAALPPSPPSTSPSSAHLPPGGRVPVDSQGHAGHFPGQPQQQGGPAGGAANQWAPPQRRRSFDYEELLQSLDEAVYCFTTTGITTYWSGSDDAANLAPPPPGWQGARGEGEPKLERSGSGQMMFPATAAALAAAASAAAAAATGEPVGGAEGGTFGTAASLDFSEFPHAAYVGRVEAPGGATSPPSSSGLPPLPPAADAVQDEPPLQVTLIRASTNASTGSSSAGSQSTSRLEDVDAVDWEIPWDDLALGEQIGQGSCGTVFHGLWHGSDVAIKVFADKNVSVGMLDDFKKEVAIMRRLRHPNVLLFMGATTSPAHMAIVTEFLPRGSLFRLIHRKTPGTTWPRKVRMALDIARGVNYLHKISPPIVHRDLKSSNLLVDRNWTVKVGDFGLSKMKHATFLSARSGRGTARGVNYLHKISPPIVHRDLKSSNLLVDRNWTVKVGDFGLSKMKHATFLEPHMRPSMEDLMLRLKNLNKALAPPKKSRRQPEPEPEPEPDAEPEAHLPPEVVPEKGSELEGDLAAAISAWDGRDVGQD